MFPLESRSTWSVDEAQATARRAVNMAGKALTAHFSVVQRPVKAPVEGPDSMAVSSTGPAVLYFVSLTKYFTLEQYTSTFETNRLLKLAFIDENKESWQLTIVWSVEQQRFWKIFVGNIYFTLHLTMKTSLS